MVTGYQSQWQNGVNLFSVLNLGELGACSAAGLQSRLLTPPREADLVSENCQLFYGRMRHNLASDISNFFGARLTNAELVCFSYLCRLTFTIKSGCPNSEFDPSSPNDD